MKIAVKERMGDSFHHPSSGRWWRRTDSESQQPKRTTNAWRYSSARGKLKTSAASYWAASTRNTKGLLPEDEQSRSPRLLSLESRFGPRHWLRENE
jgi:hypothetical protein